MLLICTFGAGADIVCFNLPSAGQALFSMFV
jgi:hypothetical protein